MNNDDIKDALTVCANNSCSGCLYYEFGNCYDKLKLDARDLITEQDQEIERLNDDYSKLQELFAQYQMASDKEIKAQVKQTKIEAVKDFAEKLKKYSYCDNDFMDGKWHRYVLVSDIDELLKEYRK